jgi:SAM-dependent methyltransferase
LTAPTDVPVGNVYDKEAADNPIERRLVAGFTSALLDLLPDDPRRVLEVGCGEGGQLRKVARLAPEARLFGFDLPSDELTTRWEGLQASMATGSAEDLPYPDDTFDLVLALEVLEHVPDPEAVLSEIARVGAGAAVLSVPWEPVWRLGNLARGRYFADWGNTPGHIQHFGRGGFQRLVARHLTVRAVRRPFPWTFVGAEVRGAHGR